MSTAVSTAVSTPAAASPAGVPVYAIPFRAAGRCVGIGLLPLTAAAVAVIGHRATEAQATRTPAHPEGRPLVTTYRDRGTGGHVEPARYVPIDTFEAWLDQAHDEAAAEGIRRLLARAARDGEGGVLLDAAQAASLAAVPLPSRGEEGYPDGRLAIGFVRAESAEWRRSLVRWRAIASEGDRHDDVRVRSTWVGALSLGAAVTGSAGPHPVPALHP